MSNLPVLPYVYTLDDEVTTCYTLFGEYDKNRKECKNTSKIKFAKINQFVELERMYYSKDSVDLNAIKQQYEYIKENCNVIINFEEQANYLDKLTMAQLDEIEEQAAIYEYIISLE